MEHDDDVDYFNGDDHGFHDDDHGDHNFDEMRMTTMMMMIVMMMTTIVNIFSEQKDVKLSLRPPALLAADNDEEKEKER